LFWMRFQPVVLFYSRSSYAIHCVHDIVGIITNHMYALIPSRRAWRAHCVAGEQLTMLHPEVAATVVAAPSI